MSLTRKVTSILIIVFVVSGLFSLGIQQMVITPSFLALEEETASQNAERALQAINRELEQIVPSVSDWAYWTESYMFVKGEMPGFVAANLEAGTTLEGMKINYLGIYDLAGNAVWKQGVDLPSGDEIELGVLTAARLNEGHPLLNQPDLESVVKGIIATKHGPMLAVAKPILTNDRQGPAVGTLVMGRFLNAAAIDRLAEQIKLPLTVTPPEPAAARAENGHTGHGLVHSAIRLTGTPVSWQAKSTISDMFGDPILTVRVDTSRDISARGAEAVRISLLSLAATALLTMLVLWLLLRRAMLQPLSQLTEHAMRVGADNNLHTKLGLKRGDEIGLLARTFDDMVDRLAEARRRLVDQSYKSGVAEMASGVLHNIGNAVTPLNVKLSTLSQELGAAPVAEMRQAVSELDDPATPTQRRGDLAQFVQLAGGELADLVKHSQDEIAAATRMVGHVHEILSDQERFSRSSRVIEPVDMDAVLRDACAGLAPALKAGLEIEIAESVALTGAVAGAHAALQQVASNLLINAAESVIEAGQRRGWVRVSAAAVEFEGRAMMHLCVADNGAGITADHFGRLFERGFTTKNRHGSGHGLHWSANTVQALGGRINAESSGAGKGACIHLWLPLADSFVEAATGTNG